jgi:hypothetical protein
MTTDGCSLSHPMGEGARVRAFIHHKNGEAAESWRDRIITQYFRNFFD